MQPSNRADLLARGHPDQPISTCDPTCTPVSQVFAGTYSIGLLFLRKQLAQERLGWNMTESVPMPLPLQTLTASASRASSESVTARRRMAAADSAMADDGTHDVFSPAAWASNAEGIDGEADDRRARTEMRQVQVVPVSLSAFL